MCLAARGGQLAGLPLRNPVIRLHLCGIHFVDFSMSFSVRPVVAALLLAASASLLTACDYAKYSPGQNPQFKEGFGTPPGYTNAEVNRDSVNYKQDVHTPIGLGSATGVQNGSTNDQLNSAPAGNSATSGQNASGTKASVDKSDPNNAASTAPAANGNAPSSNSAGQQQ
jgi:hypothetical protein